MRVRSTHRYLRFLIVALSMTAISTADVAAQVVLRVYGSEGPAPAVYEAAAVFGDQHNAKVEVVSGPPSNWLDKAVADADIIFSSAEFMMSDFVRTTKLEIDNASITPLYLHPQASWCVPAIRSRFSTFRTS